MHTLLIINIVFVFISIICYLSHLSFMLCQGATLTHHNLLNNALISGSIMRLGKEDRVCVPVPLYHCFGLTLCSLAGMIHGCLSIYPCYTFDPEAVMAAVTNEKCTVLHGVPTMFSSELELPDLSSKYDVSTLRTGIIGGSPCPEDLMRSIIQDLHLAELTVAYGATETSPLSFQTEADAPLERKVKTDGRVQPHVEAKVIDSKSGRVCKPNEKGELLVRGYSVMHSYWGQQDKTEETIDKEGYLHSGDMATIDNEGNCKIVGRLKDLIIRGGENIFPKEIEDFLHQHPDVGEVSVVGVKDDHLGEKTCACIVPHEGKEGSVDRDNILAYCKGKIAHFKVPDEVVFLESFPMTASGKVQKFKLQEQVEKKLKEEK
eukprot:TRINITY_DN10366_c0_g1_i1.p1 TRINITY_DN10366_c0_g1~~TRINITY_DN10366_c0_g1_i1.p1  ORF type:complete len:375 (+),score=81.62 TRINITY_DN10366_c0_g1_i1:785-1909(+)